MAFRLKRDESVAHGLRRLADKQLKRAHTALRPGRAAQVSDESIHDARRRLKKTRAILDILNRDDARGIGRARKRLRKASHRLARFRDADAALQTFDRVRTRAGRFVSGRTLARVRARLSAQCRALKRDPAVVRGILAARASVGKSRRSVDRWSPRHKQFTALAGAIEAAFKDGRDAMVRARRRGRASDFHEWRKAAKRLWYELRLIEAAGGRIRSDVRALDRLETWLGNDHNAVVLRARMSADARIRRAGPDLDALQAVIDRHQAGLRRKALALGARLYSRSPSRYVAEVKPLWRRWKK